jgi:hypothetical protein
MELAKAENRDLFAVLRGVSDGSEYSFHEIPREGLRNVVLFDHDLDQVILVHGVLYGGAFPMNEFGVSSRVANAPGDIEWASVT